MNSPLRILHLEDDVKDTELLQGMLEAEGVSIELTRVETEHDFVAALKRGKLDLILADYTLPSFDGVSALRLAHEHAPDVPFLFVSGTLGEDVAIEALKKGATDYVLKTRLARLGPSISRALREAQERTERKRAEEALRDSEEQWKAAFESNPVMYFMKKKPIRLLIADDHSVVREGLVSLVKRKSDIVVVAEASNGREAVDLWKRHRPDVTLLDLRMPELDGVGAIKEIRELDANAHIVVLTTYDGDEDIYRAIKAGAKAYLLKDTARDALVETVRRVHGYARRTFRRAR